MKGAAVLFFCTAGIGFATGVDYAACRGLEANTGVETKWRFGCYAHIDDRWVPSEHVFGDAQELRK